MIPESENENDNEERGKHNDGIINIQLNKK